MARGFSTTFGIGTTDKVVTALTSHASQRTYAIWASKNSAGGGQVGRFFDKRVAGSQSEVAYTGVAEIRYERTFTGGQAVWAISTASIPNGTWYHLAIAYDSGNTSNDPVFYVNGASQALTIDTNQVGTLVDNTDAYVLGNRANDNARVWDGMLAEWAVWDRILSAGEVAALARGVSPRRFPDALVEYAPLWGLASPEPLFNAAGSAGTAVVTGTARANHAPVVPFTRFGATVFDLGATAISLSPAPAAATWRVPSFGATAGGIGRTPEPASGGWSSPSAGLSLGGVTLSPGPAVAYWRGLLARAAGGGGGGLLWLLRRRKNRGRT